MKAVASQRSVHRLLAWAAGIALALWAISGLMHPILAHFGVQQATMRPPSMQAVGQPELPLGDILAKAGLAQAQSVRLVGWEGKPLLQVTESQDAPRRYFRLPDGVELPGHDATQAEALARHFLQSTAEIQRMNLMEGFSHEYPSVNRLLPVWRVEFNTPDRLTAFVYTETSTLAMVTNDTKRVVQTVFQWLHTWSWVPEAGEWGRVAVMAALLLCVLGMAYSGMRLWLGLRSLRRSAAKAASAEGRPPLRVPILRRLHKTVGLVVIIPLLAFTASGLFHLLQNANKPPEKNLQLQSPLDLKGLVLAPPKVWKLDNPGAPIAQASLVRAGDGEVLLRLQTALPSPAALPAEHDHGNAMRHARFDGRPTQTPATYLVASTGKPWVGNDRELALKLAEQHLGVGRSAFGEVSLVTRFGPEYDFRNKRLPVWKIEVGANPRGLPPQFVFVDTASGVFADRLEKAGIPERWSFSLLHKWNFLMPLIGREGVNLATGIFAAAIAGLSAVGLWLRRSRRHASAGGAGK